MAATAARQTPASAAAARRVCERDGRRIDDHDQSENECEVSHFTPLSMVPVIEMYVPALVVSAITMPLGGMI